MTSMTSKLAHDHPLEGVDDVVRMDADTHTYFVNGKALSRSATSVVAAAIGSEFDADLTISTYLASWRMFWNSEPFLVRTLLFTYFLLLAFCRLAGKNPRNKYNRVVAGLDDDAATKAIKHAWNEANRLGTKLHARLEAHMNDENTPDDDETDVEWRSLLTKLEELQGLGWVPRRAELTLWSDDANGEPSVGGQIDCLFEDAEGNLVLVDLKRTARDLGPATTAFGGKVAAAACLEGVPATDHTKYSLQLSVYAAMFQQRTGVLIRPNRRFLLQAHPELPCAILTPCSCYDTAARALLLAPIG